MQTMESKYLEIHSDRICGCPAQNLSCVTAKEWVQNMVGVWEFQYERRDVHGNLHPAAFPIALAKRCIEQFTHRGELVVDCFAGSGTTLVAAQDLERSAVGFDLKSEYVTLAKNRLHSLFNDDDVCQLAINADARSVADYIAPGTVKLCLTSPPYANVLNKPMKNKGFRDGKLKNTYGKIIQYSQDDADLGTLAPDPFEDALSDVFAFMRPVFREDAHIIINIGDVYINGERYPLHINAINAMERAGYHFRNTIIWDRRNLIHSTGIFGYPSNYITMGTTFEYILDFVL